MNKGEFHSGLIILILLIGGFLSRQSIYSQEPQNDVKMSLFAQWEDESLADTSRLKAMNSIFWQVYLFTDVDSAIFYAEKQYEFALGSKDIYWQGRALNNIGTGKLQNGEILVALDYHKRSLDALTLAGDKKQAANALNNMGLDYSYMGDLKKAIEHLFAAMKLREEVGDLKGVADSQNNIGVQYNDFGEYEKAIEYYEKALKIYKDLDEAQSTASILNNLGTVYGDLDDYDRSFDYLNQSIMIYQQLDNPYGVANVWVNMGANFMEMEVYDSAIYYLIKGGELSAEIEDWWRAAEAQSLLGRTYMQMGEFRKAIDLCTDAIPVLESVGDIAEMTEIYEIAYLSNKALNQTGEALEMYEKFVFFRDSLVNESDLRASISEEYQYQYEKQTAIDSLKSIDAQKLADAKVLAQKAELEKSDLQQYALVGGIVLLLAVIGLVLNSRRILRQQKAAVEESKELLKEQEQGLRDELKEKNKELTTLALNLAQRNDFLQEIRTELSSASRKVEHKGVKEKMKELTIQLHQYTSNNSEDEEFIRKLEEHNSNFYANLKTILPKITKKEKRLCAFLRLGLSSKEIASIANISPKSVDISRYRLRQRLGVKKGEDLQEFISNI